MRAKGLLSLITGASSGLGYEFAKVLAAEGSNLVLTARSTELLNDLAKNLRQEHGVTVSVESHDLSQSGAALELEAKLTQRGLEPDILINNAGFGLYGKFIDQDLTRIRQMLQVDLVSLTELSHVYGKRMAEKGNGRIMLVGSMAAYQPVALMAAYAAAKAYVLSFGEALNVELAPKVCVTVLSPGLMDTGFNAVSGYTTPPSLNSMKLAAAQVARLGIDGMFAGKSGVIAGRLNRVMAFGSRLLPRHLSAKASLKMADAEAKRLG